MWSVCWSVTRSVRWSTTDVVCHQVQVCDHGLLMWSVCWSVTRSRCVRWSTDVVCLLVCHQVQVCEVVY